MKYVVDCLGRHGNMVLAPINIMRNTSFENFEALVQAVREFRQL